MSDENIKVTVLLTPKAYASLELAAQLLGLSHTDTINRALIGYAEFTADMKLNGSRLFITEGKELLEIVDP